MRTYTIGDIHGQLDLLKAAHDRIAADQARHGAAPIVHIGDLVDRGPDSPGVIEYLMAGHARGEDWVTLLGNHDRMFAGYLCDLHWRDPRLRVDLSYLHPKIGGAVTLSNYGVKTPADRPLPPVQAEEDLVWIRQGFLNNLHDHGPLVVHGHTAIQTATHYGNRLNLESGAAYGGPLSAVVIEGRAAFLLTAQGREPLPITPDAPIR